MTILANVKTLLGLTDTLQDKLLTVIQELTEAHFRAYSGQDVVPVDLEYIITEVMVKRFNRIGSEGLSSQSVEGLSMSFAQDDFAEYDKVIQRHFSSRFDAGFKML